MRTTFRAASACGLAFLAAALPATAQVPGYQQLDNRQIFAEFHAEVLTSINDLMARWGDAWAEDRIDELMDLYWENAVLVPPQGAPPARGQRAIRTWLEENLGDMGGMEAFMLDFDASGGMATVFGNYLLQRDGNAATLSTGPVVTVYLLRGRTWKIRSQMFTPN